jgi:hypothetical protein
MSARKAKFVFKKHDGALIPISVHYPEWVRLVREGQLVSIDASLFRHEKTNPQLAYYYAVVLPSIEQALVDAGYNTLPATVELQTDASNIDLMLKQMFKASNNLESMPQKRDMTDEQMSAFIDFAKRYCAEQLGIEIPEPKEIR